MLRLTFSNRRKEIDGALVHVSSLLEQYPFFKIKKWVNQRIFEVTKYLFKERFYARKYGVVLKFSMNLSIMCGKGCIDKIVNNWLKYVLKILTFVNENSCKPAQIMQAMHGWRNKRNAEESFDHLGLKAKGWRA